MSGPSRPQKPTRKLSRSQPPSTQRPRSRRDAEANPHLLTPNQWNAQTAQAFDHTSYFGAAKGVSQQAEANAKAVPFDPNQSPQARKTSEDAFTDLRIKLGLLDQGSMLDMKNGVGSIYPAFGVTTPQELRARVLAACDQLEQIHPSMANNPTIARFRTRANQLVEG